MERNMKTLFILSVAVLLAACNEKQTEVIELTLPAEPVQAIQVAQAIEIAKPVEVIEVVEVVEVVEPIEEVEEVEEVQPVEETLTNE